MKRKQSEVIQSLFNLLDTSDNLDYVKADNGACMCEDIWDIVESKKEHFFNIVPNNPSKRMEQVDGVSPKQMKRHVYRFVIQYGVRSIKFMKAIIGDTAEPTFKGILDFQEDIWDTIEGDPTLAGAVRGILPGADPVPFEMLQDNEDKSFLAGGEIEVEFYNDLPVV